MPDSTGRSDDSEAIDCDQVRGDRTAGTGKGEKCTIWRGLEGFRVIGWLARSTLAESHHRHGSHCLAVGAVARWQGLAERSERSERLERW
ncbi:hypothetical protein QUA03_02715 [Microcoleus sp. S36b_A4]|uniref:hypothetical protein n=1 Tax=Microcoleus sp. S36b_A4 TaxID=3055420 RepID=UPI002FD45647